MTFAGLQTVYEWLYFCLWLLKYDHVAMLLIGGTYVIPSILSQLVLSLKTHILRSGFKNKILARWEGEAEVGARTVEASLTVFD